MLWFVLGYVSILRVRAWSGIRDTHIHIHTYTYLEQERLLGDVALLQLDKLLHGEGLPRGEVCKQGAAHRLGLNFGSLGSNWKGAV